MPFFFLKLDEIPRSAGQYLSTACVHGDIILNANAPNAFGIHTRFNRNYISGLQPPFLPLRDPGVLVNFQSQSMPRAVDKQMV